QVGFRVGDAAIEGGGVTRLHDLLKGRHALLVMLGEADAHGQGQGEKLASATAHYRPHVETYIVSRNTPSAGMLHDATGALHARLAGDSPCLCLIRPDGHLGLRASPPSLRVLKKHLKRILRIDSASAGS
ncbi:MAG: hypothetical protein AAF354_13605, partial [Pseudomonadota bacterium]